jgi:hypothetical protein
MLRSVSDPGLPVLRLGSAIMDTRPTTLGTDGTSPKAISKLGDIWYGMLDNGFDGVPILNCSPIIYANGDYTMCLMVDWWPVPLADGFLNPERVHTTVSRVRVRRNLAGPGGVPTPEQFMNAARAEVLPGLQTALSVLLKTVEPQDGAGPGATHITLTRPPWARSWNFGLSPAVIGVLGHTAGLFDHWWAARFGTGAAWLLPGRPLHVSWN